MADYGGLGGGNSLRDALNALSLMRGMGEYGAGYPPQMFPPQTGAPQPSGPVPMPQPRPQMPPQLPPGALGTTSPGMGGPPPGLPPGVGMGPPPGGPPGLAQAPGLQGNLALAGGRFGPGMGRNFAAELGLNRQV